MLAVQRVSDNVLNIYIYQMVQNAETNGSLV